MTKQCFPEWIARQPANEIPHWTECWHTAIAFRSCKRKLIRAIQNGNIDRVIFLIGQTRIWSARVDSANNAHRNAFGA